MIWNRFLSNESTDSATITFFIDALDNKTFQNYVKAAIQSFLHRQWAIGAWLFSPYDLSYIIFMPFNNKPFVEGDSAMYFLSHIIFLIFFKI